VIYHTKPRSSIIYENCGSSQTAYHSNNM